MRNISLIASAAIIVIANALSLAHSARNREGTPEAEITLTERELRYMNRSAADDDSGVTLVLGLTDSSSLPWPSRTESAPSLDQPKLERLGFDCSVPPSSLDAVQHYRRQRSRQGFVALENEGAALPGLGAPGPTKTFKLCPSPPGPPGG